MSAIGKVFKTIFVLLGLVGIATSAAFIIKSPSSFKDLGREIGIVKDSVDDATNQSLPYLMTFSTIKGTGSGYKSSYISAEGSSKKWYCSWGTEPTIAKDKTTISYILGWNNIEKVYYGGYTYKNEIQKLVDDSLIEQNYKFTYLVMDFDFSVNHSIQFNLSPFDDLKDSKLYLITSNNKGESWSVSKEQNMNETEKNKSFAIKQTFKASGVINKRYGLLLISKSAYARLEVDSFFALSEV